jgi:serine O-acetyltransferase
MRLIELWKLIGSDLARFEQTYRLRGQTFSKVKVIIESLLFKPGFQGVLFYRLSHWLFANGWVYPAWLLSRFSVALTGAEIEFNAIIGPGLFIAHPVGIVIGRGAVIGSQATLFQGVTFGVKRWDPDSIHKFPKVGNCCTFFSHCTIMGGISIGDYCVVGANTLVDRDLTSGCLAVGVPAQVYPNKGKDATLASMG